MTSDAARAAFEDLQLKLDEDLEEGVTRDGDVLSVHGTRFAALDGDDLVVALPDTRIADLTGRDLVTAAEPAGGRAQVRVSDTELWEELASEAHDFVGEPAVGRDS